MKKRRWPRELGPKWLRWLLFLGACLAVGFALTLSMQWVLTGQLMLVQRWAVKYPAYVLATGLFLALAVYLLGALLDHLPLGATLVCTVGMGLTLTDYFKLTINGTPLTLADFGMVNQLGQVAGVAGDLSLPRIFIHACLYLLAGLLVLWLLRPLLRLGGGRPRFLAFSLPLMLAVGLFCQSGVEWVGRNFSVDIYTRMDATGNHETYGLMLSLWRDSALQDIQGPEGYGEAYMEEVLQRLDTLLADYAPAEETKETAVQPNILFVLSESFFDLTRLPDMNYGADPLANFHALEQESLSGYFQSHYLGYGTGYLEMSMLYGVTAMDFTLGSNICFLEEQSYDYFSSLPEAYTAQGYRAEMLHAYSDSLYNRTVTYPRLGFDASLFSPQVQALDIGWNEGNPYGGYYLRDKYLFRGMLKRMEDINAGGQLAFLYGITMENHQPFDAEKFNYACQIELTSPKLDEADLAIAKVMLEGITRADQALGELTETLRQSDVPTIVVFFGDHRPNLIMTDETQTIYTKLGLCPQRENTNWTPEQAADIYSTDYLIWANDPTLLEGLSGTREDSSVTTIGPRLMNLTGAPHTRYWALLDQVGQVSRTNTELYFMNGEGEVFPNVQAAALSPAEQELLDLKAAVLYDAFYGKQYITERMNLPVQK